jgi:hypothetical protein
MPLDVSCCDNISVCEPLELLHESVATEDCEARETFVDMLMALAYSFEAQEVDRSA